MLASLLECAVSSPRDKRCNIVDDDTAVLRMSLVDANHPLTCQFKSYQARATFGYPPAGTKKFGIWQELGSGADGTVRMASTVPSAICGSCVTAFAVKFFHEVSHGEETKPPAEIERDHYRAIYTPHMFPKHAFQVVCLQQQCLLLPYFKPTPKNLRGKALEELERNIFPAMTNAKLRLNVDEDDEVHWRHVLNYCDSNGAIHFVFIDLLRLLPNPCSHKAWESHALGLLRQRM